MDFCLAIDPFVWFSPVLIPHVVISPRALREPMGWSFCYLQSGSAADAGLYILGGAVAGIRCTKMRSFPVTPTTGTLQGMRLIPVVADKILSAPAGRVPEGNKINK